MDDFVSTVHCGYLILLFLGLLAELAAGRALAEDTSSTDPELQSVIEDLQAALQVYSSVLRETSFLRDFPVQRCGHDAAHLHQVSLTSHCPLQPALLITLH
ncbi:Hypothetical protein SMAX5B_021720 [Scophthalmus maximus]|uniref:Uncharacterized protein n=1 Tax=Scophthalmus maximus TaxID=52904 RepID=A0A2U9CI25_SCOMX|nr:Hypothetical protein SMAX5B_021720 [Scophthalmus maximus]